VKGAVKRTVEQLREKAAQLNEQRKQDRRRAGGKTDDPVAEAGRQRDRQLRELADQAHGVNLDLGQGLVNGLSTVDPASLEVVKFYVYSALGGDYSSGYGQAGERIHHLAVAGIRLVVGELRTDVTKTRKDGSRGRLRIDYGDQREPGAALKWLWRYVDAAHSAGELYGRGLVVISAEQYAARMVLPASQRSCRTAWSSHKDIGAKALAKLAGPHLPVSLKALERAIKRAHDEYDAAIRVRSAAVPAAGTEEPVEADGQEDEEVEADPDAGTEQTGIEP
jgi:hypothetical protein